MASKGKKSAILQEMTIFLFIQFQWVFICCDIGLYGSLQSMSIDFCLAYAEIVSEGRQRDTVSGCNGVNN